MKIKSKIITAAGFIMIAIMVLFAACKEEITGPPTVPIKAEVKQVIINNSLYTTEFYDLDDTDGVDTVVVAIPQGTDITTLEMDLIYSYFGKIEPEVSPTTDLSSPKTYTVTANLDSDYEESRQYIIEANLVPPSLTSFFLTAPWEKAGKITGDSIVISLLEGQDYSSVGFIAEFFGESIEPSMDQTLDLSKDTIITVINKEFRNDYKIIIDWYKIIEFTGFIYDGTEHPNVEFPGSIDTEDSAYISIVESEGAVLGGKAARYTNLDDGGKGSLYWIFAENDSLDNEAEEITIIMRGRGYKTKEESHRYLEIVFFLGPRRFQFWVTLDKGLDGTGWGETPYETIAQGLDPLDWNTYRMTANMVTGEVLLYLNENPDPLPEFMPLSMDGGRDPQWKAGFGDGSGGNTYDGEYDYFIIETGGAYSPEDLPLSKILPQ